MTVARPADRGICELCGGRYSARRATSRFCSAACRQRAHRRHRGDDDATYGRCPTCHSVAPVTASRGNGWEVRHGDYRVALADVGAVDAMIVDPPYGARTHRGHDAAAGGLDRRELPYSAWSAGDVAACVRWAAPRVRGWIAVMSCSSLAAAWADELAGVGRYVYAPLPCVIRGMTVRLSGDGPSSWTVWLTVARPRSREHAAWGTLPGAYSVGRGDRRYPGGKPVELMSQIVADYTSPGDLVCDPCAGMATTGAAALAEGRRFVGAEIDHATYMAAVERLREVAQ